MGKSKYESHVVPHFEDIFYWYSHDWTLEDIAIELGVSKYSFLKYKAKYIDLFDLLKKAEKSRPRHIANKAERALKDKLQDKEVEEVETEIWKDANGKITKQHIKKKKRVIPSDTTAIIFALKNNDKERYGEKDNAELEIIKAKLDTLRMTNSGTVEDKLDDLLNKISGELDDQ